MSDESKTKLHPLMLAATLSMAVAALWTACENRKMSASMENSNQLQVDQAEILKADSEQRRAHELRLVAPRLSFEALVGRYIHAGPGDSEMSLKRPPLAILRNYGGGPAMEIALDSVVDELNRKKVASPEPWRGHTINSPNLGSNEKTGISFLPSELLGDEGNSSGVNQVGGRIRISCKDLAGDTYDSYYSFSISSGYGSEESREFHYFLEPYVPQP